MSVLSYKKTEKSYFVVCFVSFYDETGVKRYNPTAYRKFATCGKEKTSKFVKTNHTPMEGYPTRPFAEPVKRYCRMLDLRDDPQLIALYRHWHSAEHHWPEIREGIRSVGILEMEIYLIDNHLFMIVDAPLDFDWSEAMEQLAVMPRQREWEEFVASFQRCDRHADADDKWRMMERIFRLW